MIPYLLLVLGVAAFCCWFAYLPEPEPPNDGGEVIPISAPEDERICA